MKLRTFNGPSSNPMAGKAVLPQSLVSLRLELLRKGICIGNATGFVERSPHGLVLVTNRHVMTGRHRESGKLLDEVHAQVPDTLRVWFRDQRTMLPCYRDRPLFDEEQWPLWREHPTLGARADIAALPIGDLGPVHTFPLAESLEPPPNAFKLLPTDTASIVGFPFAKHVDGFPVWTTGSVASEPDFNFDGLPTLLVDARTREGQSGSPVYFHSNEGNFHSDSGLMIAQGTTTVFLGIYSGRIDARSDIGIVWRAPAVRAAVESGILSDADDPDMMREARTRGPA